MAKQFGFFNSINGDRKYLATDISNAFDTTTNNGLKAVQDSFKIVPNENMTVKMMPGGCMIFGHYCLDDEEEIIQLDTADAELDRIDRIVVRYDKFERSIKTVVIKGTPALTPTPPAVLRNENQFDLVLADIRINKATTEITAANITDMRESELCGFIGVKGAASEIEFKNHIEGPFHIVESGQNSNGNYIRFADGTQVCYISELTLTKTDNTNYRDAFWYFPSEFVDRPGITMSHREPYLSGMSRALPPLRISQGDSLKVRVLQYAPDGKVFSNDDYFTVSVFAIGRWK